MGTYVLLTGGAYNPYNRVSQYNEAGWVRDLPGLLQRRYYHGCSYYDNNEGSQVRY